MNDGLEGFCMGIVSGLILTSIFVAMVIVPVQIGNNDTAWKAAAIKHGAAEYQLNPQTGEVRFAWKESK